ncbi:MAG: cellulose biosynthesis cyclic di-GMP-binding regulatory protein BcsB [Trichocoleus desertorum ATA4-8-CV12]|nr:cellulose biosynthesis cyclic di-GMP-binding regulatory protein BcsB [Trichocoleus desertorum ATA4-8-CV12]
MPRIFRPFLPSSRRQSRPGSRQQRPMIWLLLLSFAGTAIGVTASLAVAQQSDRDIKEAENQIIEEFTLPEPPPQAPVYQPAPAPAPDPGPVEAPAPREPAPYQPAPEPDPEPAPAPAAPEPTSSTPSEPTTAPSASPPPDTPVSAGPTIPYVMEFNRSPVVGNRLRLQGVFSDARLGFTRPRNWNLRSAKVLVRFQHSPALLANRSNLTVRVNGTSIGSVPLNRKQSEIGQVLLNVPPNLIQDFNEVSLVAQQNNSATCTDPADPTLWTEILPDSKLLFNYQPKPVKLDFARYPYPFFDNLSLDPNRVTYLLPNQVDSNWLTSAARFQASLGRLAEFRPLETRLVKNINQARADERLVMIGTPEAQPGLKALKLPLAIAGNQVLDGNRNPLPPDAGILMLATTRSNGVPVLIATGNGPEGVNKAVQFLVQPQDRQISTGYYVVVNDITPVPTPSPRQWPGYLPDKNSFQLSDLKTADDQPFQDVTVRGAYAPPVEVNFRALPDDQFTRGSSMNLVYSHGPQVNPRLSTVEVRLDGAPIGGKRLTAEQGATRETLNVNLPADLIKPDSKIQVVFNLSPREPANCGRVNDQQLWGKVHADTRFNLKRQNVVQIPDLKLLSTGYPFTAPQDLSTTAIVLPTTPSITALSTFLEFSERLGRLSQADTVKVAAYTVDTLPEDVREQQNLVAIGERSQFPFPEAFQASGFVLKDLFSRKWNQSQIQALPDAEGVIKEVISPWNPNRVLLALSAQTETGLQQVQNVLNQDPLFFQLNGDTALVSANQAGASGYDPDAYNLEFLQQSSPRRLDNSNPFSKVSRFLQDNWFVLPTGIVVFALGLYGVTQLYLKRVAKQDK